MVVGPTAKRRHGGCGVAPGKTTGTGPQPPRCLFLLSYGGIIWLKHEVIETSF